MKPIQIEARKSFRFDAIDVFTDYKGTDWNVGIDLKVFNGRPEVFAVAIWTDDFATPITRRTMREIPIDMVIERVLKVETSYLKTLKAQSSKSQYRQGRKHSDEDLSRLADIYRAAFENRLPVQQTVADTLGISKSTAVKRISEARRRGFIEER